MGMWLQCFFISACIVLSQGGRFAFYKNLQTQDGYRRVFGGTPVSFSAFPAACALLDRYMETRCSATVVAQRWALTAAHCATPNVLYVRYTLPSGKYDHAPVHLLYTHPEFRVVEKDEGEGMDVVLLHNDVGLVRTRRDMTVAAAPALRGVSPDPVRAMLDYDAQFIYGEEVELLGYGRSEAGALGAQLLEVRLRVATCERSNDAWRHCGCARGGARGVCAGDSGGPVMFKGRQVGVTSMGPIECSPVALISTRVGEPAQPEATSVFTSIHPYVELINSTIHEIDQSIRMKVVAPSAAQAPVPICAVFISQAVFLLFLL